MTIAVGPVDRVIRVRDPATSSRSLSWAVAAGCLLVACAGTPRLVPAPEAQRTSGDPETAEARVAGVRIEVDTDAWTGRDGIDQHVTPVLVAVENDGPTDVRLRYSDFALVADSGTYYAALPPLRIEGSIREPLADPRVAPPHVGFRHSRFHVAPPYRRLYPGIRAHTAPYYYDPLAYGTYYGYWDRVPLPTEGMLERALPEGVLAPGGRVQGFLYFERVTEQSERVQFRAQLVAADTGRVLAVARIPYRVE